MVIAEYKNKPVTEEIQKKSCNTLLITFGD